MFVGHKPSARPSQFASSTLPRSFVLQAVEFSSWDFPNQDMFFSHRTCYVFPENGILSSDLARRLAPERSSERAIERHASDERLSLLRRRTGASLRAKTSTLLERKTRTGCADSKYMCSIQNQNKGEAFGRRHQGGRAALGLGSHANTSQSHMKTRANTIQEFLNLLEAMQILRRTM